MKCPKCGNEDVDKLYWDVSNDVAGEYECVGCDMCVVEASPDDPDYLSVLVDKYGVSEDE